MNALQLFLWVIFPYMALVVFVLGHVWRYRHDKFGWTTRSSQIHEQRLLSMGAPLFHFGILAALGGHVVGILVPASWLRDVGVPDSVYHALALGLGVVSGGCALLGLGILGYRRITVRPVARNTTRNDKIMYTLLAATIIIGLGSTLLGESVSAAQDYRATVAPWFRSVFRFEPDGQLMTHAALGFQIHAVTSWLLIAWWPFSVLVHVFSAPLGFVVRPYIVYRSRRQVSLPYWRP